MLHSIYPLGLDFDQSVEEMDKKFAKAVEKMQKVAKNWGFLYLTVFGKICVIKTLMLQKLAHIATILKIEEIEKICLKFLKTNKRSIVDSSKTLYTTNAQNGLELTRISEF